jgi:recombination protein RecT
VNAQPNAYEKFKLELQAKSADLIKLAKLAGIDGERFIIAAREHVTNKIDDEKQNLLVCNNLFAEIAKAAEDGIYPDGREGYIGRFWDSNNKCNLAAWIPMVRGIRRRAADMGVKIDAEIVYKNDYFDWQKGDHPSITHTPAPLGDDHSDIVGAYAIFRDVGSGTIIHREVMDTSQLQAVRGISKQPNGLMWSKFADEGYRKAPLRRGIKSAVNIDARLAKIVERGDAMFDVGGQDSSPSASSERPKCNLTPPSAAKKKELNPPSAKAPANTVASEPKPDKAAPAAAPKLATPAEDKITKTVRIISDTKEFTKLKDALRKVFTAHKAGNVTAAQYGKVSAAFTEAAARIIANETNDDTRNEIIIVCQDFRDEKLITMDQYGVIAKAHSACMEMAA